MIEPLTRRGLFSGLPLLALPRLAVASAQSAKPEDLLTGLRSSRKAPSVSAAVWKKGVIVWSGSVGIADLESSSPASPRTRYRIGSVSKLLTVAAAMRLYQQGRLDLDAPVQKYLPSLPAHFSKVTPRLLMGHLSGIGHYGPAQYLNSQPYASVAETLKIFQNLPLVHDPGAKYAYSSYGYNLLGAVLEQASSLDFRSLVQQQVCEPLRLQNTVADENRSIIAGRARYYSLTEGKIEHSPYTDLSDRWPSGGFLSTAEDLVRFGSAHTEGTFLNSEVRQLIFTPQRTSDGKDTPTGLGWRMGALAGKSFFHHGGDAIGGRAFLLINPKDSTTVALLANLTFAKLAEGDALALADLFA